MRVAETGTPGSKRLDVPRLRPTESCRVCGSDWLRNSRLSEMLDQEIGQNPYFPYRMLPRGPNDIQATWSNRKLRQDRNERVGGIRFNQKVRQLCDAESCNGRGGQGNRVVRFEPALGTDGDHLGTIHEPPCLGPL